MLGGNREGEWDDVGWDGNVMGRGVWREVCFWDKGKVGKWKDSEDEER